MIEWMKDWMMEWGINWMKELENYEIKKNMEPWEGKNGEVMKWWNDGISK